MHQLVRLLIDSTYTHLHSGARTDYLGIPRPAFLSIRNEPSQRGQSAIVPRTSV